MTDTRADGVSELLEHGRMEVEGRLVAASNATFVVRVFLDGQETTAVYKPVRGERPLWDFPDGTLAARETAAYLVSAVSGWDLVPATLIRDGPFGPGMVQRWCEPDSTRALVDLVPAGEVPLGWLRILDAEDTTGRPVSLAHADDPALRRMAVFDAVVNNADRKGGHILAMTDGSVLGVDHGVCFHTDEKLRTVLWGWAGDPIPESLVADLAEIRSMLDPDCDRLGAQLSQLLSDDELVALQLRVETLLATRRHPFPPRDWHAIPWPAF